jgi:glucose-1-phosphate thymidylyltransferase
VSVRTRKAVILARGLGTRMRAESSSAELDRSQAAVAATGVKAMIPVGRPFLDYVLSALADSEFTDACLVIGPEHSKVRDYYEREMSVSRIRIHFAEQAKPLGTADAVLAANRFVGEDPFVVLNSDNYYPVRALEQLACTEPPAIVGFDRATLIEDGNVPPERVGRFGALDIDTAGYLRRILVSPTEEMLASGTIYASMNCWLFTPEIFRACREVPLSARGELELPKAVQLSIDKYGLRFRVTTVSEPVLDMSNRGDIASIAERLRAVSVSL